MINDERRSWALRELETVRFRLALRQKTLTVTEVAEVIRRAQAEPFSSPLYVASVLYEAALLDNGIRGQSR